MLSGWKAPFLGIRGVANGMILKQNAEICNNSSKQNAEMYDIAIEENAKVCNMLFQLRNDTFCTRILEGKYRADYGDR